MFLGIEIGGTKLQLGVGPGDGGPLVALKRLDVNPQLGADRIRGQIEQAGKALVEAHEVEAVGIGFGGPVDVDAGRTVVSHQVDGWKDFPLADWCRETFGLPTVLSNDSDSAGLAEARFGAGRGHRIVFYTNVGSGIGGAFAIDGNVYRGGAGIASELGHLRPGLAADSSDQTLESIASGWGITAAVRRRLTEPDKIPQPPTNSRDVTDLLGRCDNRIDALTTKQIGQAAESGNSLAQDALAGACRAFGWAIAQMVTLLAPNVVVVGGGVSLVGEELFFAPLREHVRRYVFPPLRDSFEVLPAKLGEQVVIYGALALAAEAFARNLN